MTVAFPLFHALLLLIGLTVASVLDVTRRRVPNWLCVGIATCGVLARLLLSGPTACGWGVLGTAVGLLLLLLPFARGWVGGGDVKLLAAVGAWLGPTLVLVSAVLAAAVAGLIALVCWLRSPPDVRREIGLNLKSTVLSRAAPEVPERSANLSPPMAPAIAAGAILTGAMYWQLLLSF